MIFTQSTSSYLSSRFFHSHLAATLRLLFPRVPCALEEITRMKKINKSAAVSWEVPHRLIKYEITIAQDI